MTQNEWYVLFLEEYVKYLESELENQTLTDIIKRIMDDNKNIKHINPWKIDAPKSIDPNHCPKCWLKLEGVMGYCCPNVGCPTGLGPVMCKVNHE